MTGEPGPLDPVTRPWRRRRERLLSFLPRIFGMQPEGSAVATLLDGLAHRLASLDVAIDRVLRDRWVATAGGAVRWDDGVDPLDRLAALLELERAEPWEDRERFRRRVRATAPILASGSTSVRSLLGLTAAALDTELCPRLVRDQDTTLGIGVRPGTRAGCPSCATPGGSCHWVEALMSGAEPAASPVVARFQLTDSPVSVRSLSLAGLGHREQFVIRNPSLFADRPAITLKALGPVTYPVLEQLASGDVVLYAGELAAGETLTFHPRRTAEERALFHGFKAAGVLPGRADDDHGRAVIVGPTGARDVSSLVYYIHEAAFDRSRFGGDDAALDDPTPGARFAQLAAGVVTPPVEPGEVRWRYVGYTRFDLEAVAGDQIPPAVITGAPHDSRAGEVDVGLVWWARRPASFRLRIPLLPPPPPGASADDVNQLLRRVVDQARAAGVQAAVDIPLPPRREQQPLGERLAIAIAVEHTESHAVAESPLGLRSTMDGERHDVEAVFSISGVVDGEPVDLLHPLPED